LLNTRCAEHIISALIWSLETTLLNNLETDGFTLKLNGFGKFLKKDLTGPTLLEMSGNA
jgi:hypothetical protein